MMIQPKHLKKGDTVAIVSLSSGMLGEEFCSHYIELGQQRLKDLGLKTVFMPNALKGIKVLNENPKYRAEDLKMAFESKDIDGIFCAIGGDDTFRLIPHLLEDDHFIKTVKSNPKIFTGFSDTTINHLTLYKIGLQTFYGPNYINDLSEMGKNMLSYTKSAVENFYLGKNPLLIKSASHWYEERTNFSADQMGIERRCHLEEHGYTLLQGKDVFSGALLGGCVGSLYDLLTGSRYPEEIEINRKYSIFPNANEWKNKIMFLETSQERPNPDELFQMLSVFKKEGVFDAINGIIVGKPQNEIYYEDYKKVYIEAIGNKDLPILYNVNFGHAYPRTVLAYGAKVQVDAKNCEIRYLESLFSS